MASIVVKMAETHTRNMTGFSIWTRGSSLAKESLMARVTMALSAKALLGAVVDM